VALVGRLVNSVNALLMPETFLSLEQSDKHRIPFVQGKFNMGGTAVFFDRPSLYAMRVVR
jgi:hypothetical protein